MGESEEFGNLVGVDEVLGANGGGH
jgi:hypothetical protein